MRFYDKKVEQRQKIEEKPDYSLELNKQCLPIAQIYLSSTNDRGMAQH
jgi:hypothetical protein